MGHRNMISTGQMFDIEMDEQGQGHHPEPCIFLGNIADITHPNVHPILSASGRMGSVDLHHLPEHQDDSIYHGTQYNGLQHHHPFANLDLGAAAAASNFYNPYMVPSSGTIICPVPLNHASLDQLPSSSNQGIIGHGVDDYERNSYFMDGFRGSGKRKNAEGIPGNYHHINASESSSSSSLGAPLNTVLHQWGQQFESGANVLDAEAFGMPECEGNGILSITEGGPRRSVRSRSNAIDLMGSALAYNNNHLVQGNYMGQSSQPTNSAWVEHQFGTNGGDGSTSAWNYGPTISYLHGRGVSGGGSLEIGGLSGQGYQEVTNNRNFPVLLHSSLHPHHYHQRHHHLPHYHYPSPMQGMQSHSYTYHPQVPTPYSHPTSSNALHHGTLNPTTESLGAGTRHPRPFPSSGLRIYHPRRRGAPHAALEGNNRPRLRILSTDEVAILEFPPGFYEVGNFVDQHRDMRLDIDDMSYEELLALEERIGNVITGLSEETITKCLRTRTHVSNATYFNLNQSASIDEETETCIICQAEFENQEKIGTLGCGHEYHADCIKKWLVVKNVCPICKKSALAVENKGRI